MNRNVRVAIVASAIGTGTMLSVACADRLFGEQTMATTQPSASVLKAGQKAPDFSLDATMTGKKIALSDYTGKTVVLYFYPKADTPGCTKEACSFRDAQAEYRKRGYIVLGISPDALDDQQKFTDKYGLNFPLLADPDHAIAQKYGVWQKKTMAGREYMGAARTTFVIGPDGTILHTFENVKPEGHDQEVLEWLAQSTQWSGPSTAPGSQDFGRSHTGH